MSPAPERSTKVRNGSCLCKSIKYQVVGEPITMRVCNCPNCRKATGSAFMTNVFFSEENIRVLQGEEKLKIYHDDDTAAGVRLNRYFCSECGSNVFLRSVANDPNRLKLGIIAYGTLDDEVDWIPRTELFPEHRRHFIKGFELRKKSPPKL
ncbi:Mss4-like protein [Flammula alnicola]|nr:Mss4-like protein [Flammula alnicola]